MNRSNEPEVGKTCCKEVHAEERLASEVRYGDPTGKL